MEKLKSCSFYFLFISAILVVNSFLFTIVSAETTIDTDITEDTTWAKDGSPYVINSDVYVEEGATLFLLEGVVVKFDNSSSLIVDGKIDAEGTVAEPIYFTSIYDDEIGGNTNKDYEDYEDCSYDEDGYILEETCKIIDLYQPYAGDWGDIFIESPTEQSILNNVIQRYSTDELYLYNGASLSSTNYDSDQGVSVISSKGHFDNLKATFLYVQNSSDVTLLNSKIKGVDNDVVYIFDNSTAIFENVEIDKMESQWSFGTAIYVFDNSSLDIKKSSISKINDGIQIFQGSTLKAVDLSIECTDTGISMFENSNLNLSGGTISCLNDGLALFSEVTANISGVKITDALDAGIIAYNNTDPNSVTITKSEITGNNYGFVVFGSPISVNQNSIHDNLSGGAITYDPSAPIIFDFTNNYWGDTSGPLNYSTNPTGLGNKVSDNILFTPFLKFDPLKRLQNPVILIPGITGTYLIRDYGDKTEIWPDISRVLLPGDDIYLNDLTLELDGTENIKMPIKTGDIIRGITLPAISDIHVFDRLISELINNGGYVEDTDLFVFPYDWRISTSLNAVLLKEKIDKILLDTGYENVDIVAHSMGGLIAKKYIIDNGEDEIDQLIFLGTPQFGAPKAFKALMFGDNMGYGIAISDTKKISVLNASRVKYISQNMPSVYELLPSEKYIESNGSYVTNALDRENTPIDLDYEQTEDLMIGKGRNSLMFPFADDLHNSIDDLDLSGIETYNFVGCGTKTIGGITVKQKRAWIKLFLGWKDDFELKYVNGDETVPLESANKAIGAKMYFASGNTHGSLPSAEGVRQNILSILKGEDLQDYSNILDDASTCNISGDVVSTHSPVELHIYDEIGNHTGPNSDGDIEYGVIGVQYDVIDEENYAFLPDGVNYKIVTKATDTGGYNFMIEEQSSNDIITATYNWTLIPLDTINTQGEIWIGPDYSPNEYQVKIDEDGDGTIDANYESSYDGTTEAEKATTPSRKFSSGSIPRISLIPVTTIQNLEIKTPVLESVQEKQELVVNTVIITDIDKGESINKEKVEDSQIKRNHISASVGDSGVEIDLLFPAIILFGLIGVSLAKMFIKL